MAQVNEHESLLALCQQIPVLSPGSIQAHGALLAFSRAAHCIEYVSANIGEILGGDPSTWLGTTFSPGAHELFSLTLDSLQEEKSALLILDKLELRISSNAHYFLVEFCRTEASQSPATGHWSNWSGSLLSANTPEALHKAAIEAMQGLIAYDHLMIYRFDDKWNGQVVDEWINPTEEESYEPYLNLCFPESDIPAQARALYLQNWVRNTADVASTAIPLVAQTEKPLILSSAYLRSVAPSHIHYLKNMGVTASFSISIILDGKLWGLLAAHHNKPKQLSLSCLVAAEELAKLYSSLLTLELRKEYQRGLDSYASFLAAPTLAASHGKDGLDMTEAQLQQTCKLFECHTVVIWDGGIKRRWGESPPDIWLFHLMENLSKKTFTDHIYHTAQLSESMPELAATQFAGVMALSAPIESERLILLLRKEEPQEIEWGGDPRLEAMTLENGFLSPRNSFRVWRQTLSGFSRPWTSTQQLFGTTFAGNLVMANAILGTLENVQKTAKLNLLNMLLHDVGNALSGISGGVTRVHQQTQDHSGLHNLKRVADFISTQVNELDQALGPGRGVALQQLLAEISLSMENAFNGIAQATEWIETSMTHARELLDLQKTYAQSTTHYTRECHVVELLSDAISVLRTSIDSRGKIIMQLAEQLPALTIDRSKLMQVIINLIKNGFESWDARSDDKPALKIELHAFIEADVLYLKICDNGAGFSESQAEKLFITEYSTKERSSGVGLLNCKRLANNTGVGIALKSTGANQGAVATLSIPKELWI